MLACKVISGINAYAAKFLGAWSRYGIKETLLLTRDFFRRRWASICGLDVNALYEGVRYSCFPPDVYSLQRKIDLDADEKILRDHTGVAVILHCHYVHLLPHALPWLSNLPRSCQFYVSTDTNEKKQKILKILNGFNFSLLDVRVLPNRGFDIAPFFIGFRDILLTNRIVLKIHIKLSPQLPTTEVQNWNKLCFDTLLGSKKRVQDIISHFIKNNDIGIIAPNNYYRPVKGLNYYFMKILLKAHHIDLPRDVAIDFPSGSMFWCRSKALLPWLNLKLSFEDFEDSARSPRDGTLAHALERLMFYGCGIEGLFWGRLSPPTTN